MPRRREKWNAQHIEDLPADYGDSYPSAAEIQTATIWVAVVEMFLKKDMSPGDDVHPNLRTVCITAEAMRTAAKIACDRADIDFDKLVGYCLEAAEKRANSKRMRK